MTVGENTLLCGRYRLQRSIGRGGMAEVFLAFDNKRQAPVAVKILREDMAEEPDFGRRFRREAEALALLDHPNIVHYYGFEQDGPIAFIVMDYIEGATLRRRLHDRRGPLPIEEVTEIVRDLSAALHYAHQNGFVHRDLKPGNIMLQATGHALLTDFGISCALEGITQTAASLGTPAYMSPEQIECAAVDARSDIYSLGVLLFEMTTGRRPFTGEEPGLTQTGTTARIREAHLYLPPPDPRGLNPYLPQAAAAVILRALAKSPDSRWPDVLSLRRAWEASLGLKADTGLHPAHREEHAPRREERPPTPPAKPVRPANRLLYAAGAGLLVLALVLVFALRRPPAPAGSGAPAGPPAPTALATDAPRSTRTPVTGGVVVQGGGRPTTASAGAAAPTAAPAAPSAAPTARSGVIIGGGRASPTPARGQAAVEPTLVPTFRPAPTAAVRTPAGQGNAPAPTVPPAPAGGVTLLRPANGAAVVGEVEFAWQPDPGFALAAGETYELIVWTPGEDPLVHGRSPVGARAQTSVRVNLSPVETALRLRSGNLYYWGVRLWREPGGAIRMLAAGRSFIYDRAGSTFNSPLPPGGDGEK